MNYFEHHIGDYDKNTSHLTACEDGIYHRMIRRYLDKETPLDRDVAEIKRVVRARTKEEKSAVDSILKEFFQIEDDGWHNKTCDEKIAEYQAGEPEREAKKANEETRLKRHRDERAALFQQLTAAGKHAAWNIGIKELRDQVKALPAPATNDDPATLPATAPATPATATQTPIPIPTTQTPEIKNIGAVAPDNTIERRQGTLEAIEAELDRQVPTKPAPVVLPDWMPMDAWQGYLDMRKKQKKVPTDRAISNVLLELGRLKAAGNDVAAVLDQSTTNAWTDVYPLKERSTSQRQAGRTSINDFGKQGELAEDDPFNQLRRA